MLDVVSFIGVMVLSACFFVGAYVWMRWGWVGVATIWSVRKELDRIVRAEAVQTWMDRP